MKSASISRAIIALLIFCLAQILSIARGQSNFYGCSVFDTIPIDGAGDDIVSGLLVGEAGSQGLVRGMCGVLLPPQPGSSKLVKATLSLYLYGVAGSAGDASFGPLSLYHNPRPRPWITLNSEDYSDSNYLLVTRSVVTPASPGHRYYDFEVTSQIAADYALGGATANANFRLQVDGLQFLGGYRCYGLGVNRLYPIQMELQFQPILCYTNQNSPGTLTLSWATNFGNYALESAVSPTAQTWDSVTNQAVVAGGWYRVALDTGMRQRFFRLRQR